MSFIPHNENDVKNMLASIGIKDIDVLFEEIPEDLKNLNLENIPEGISEMELIKLASFYAARVNHKTCFLGAGSYEHYIPAAVWDICSRGEFLTSYTPYQAEASQGTLQVIYEYQTMIAELTKMDVANASMYDGASALAEAILMAIRINHSKNEKRILIPDTLHPLYLETVKTIVANQHIEIISLPYDLNKGITNLESLESYVKDNITALVIPQPNFFGCLEDVDKLTNWASKNQITTIACVNPISLCLLKPPGEWGDKGVDIVCGEGQPLGTPIAFGGPYFGFFSAKKEYVRQMPGRLVSSTTDSTGQKGFTLTLQTREQHIRRGKAMSNICTNQGLHVTAAAIYMSILGAHGMASVAKKSHANTCQLRDNLIRIDGVRQVFATPFFNEVLLSFNKPVNELLENLYQAGFLAGLEVEKFYPNLKNTLLICATETRTTEEINSLTQAVESFMSL